MRRPLESPSYVSTTLIQQDIKFSLHVLDHPWTPLLSPPARVSGDYFQSVLVSAKLIRLVSSCDVALRGDWKDPCLLWYGGVGVFHCD